jgi:hypothetical protein
MDRSIDEVILQGAPEAVRLAVGLRPIRPGVAVNDAEFDERRFERALAGGDSDVAKTKLML